MDRTAAFAVVAAFPVLCVAFYISTRSTTPIVGYWMALAFYWFAVLLPLIVWRGGFRRTRFAMALPTRGVVVANGLFVAAVAGVAALSLWQHPQPALALIFVACVAVINGSLEEIFWRGTLLRDDASQRAQTVQWLLFTGWHVAILFSLMAAEGHAGVVIHGGAPALLGGAAVGGLLWTLSKMQSGSVGFGLLCHVMLNVAAFTALTTDNPLV